MLKITKNSTNQLYVTVTEKTVIDPSYYLMALYSKDNKSTKVLRFSGDSSTNTERWNIFSLTETTSALEDLENAKVNLVDGGQYSYTIYSTSSISGTSISGAGIVERGLLTVGTTGSTSSTFTNSNSIITFQ